MFLLFLSQSCDLPENNWAIWTFGGLGTAILAYIRYQRYLETVDGPRP